MTTFIIAEVGSVHDGSFGNALHLIDAAAATGADAVKFQTHISQAETLRDAPMPPYFKGEPRFEYFDRTGFTVDQWKEIKRRCEDNEVVFLSSPFSEEAVDLLDSIGMEQYKIPSGEVSNLPMLQRIARLHKPVILSSGMSSWEEIDRAVETIQAEHNHLSILQCTTEYPCAYEHVGLNIMKDMANRYDLPVGLSDHTLTTYAAFAAVSLGASIIEKHFTFSRKMYGSDAKHSLEPDEFRDMIEGIRAIEVMLTSQVDKSDITPFENMKATFEKSVVTVVPLPKGTVIQKDMLGLKKPGTGIPAANIDRVIGKKAKSDIDNDTLLTWDDLI